MTVTQTETVTSAGGETRTIEEPRPEDDGTASQTVEAEFGEPFDLGDATFQVPAPPRVITINDDYSVYAAKEDFQPGVAVYALEIQVTSHGDKTIDGCPSLARLTDTEDRQFEQNGALCISVAPDVPEKVRVGFLLPEDATPAVLTIYGLGNDPEDLDGDLVGNPDLVANMPLN